MKIVIGDGLSHVCFEQFSRGAAIYVTSAGTVSTEAAVIEPDNIAEAARALAMLAREAEAKP